MDFSKKFPKITGTGKFRLEACSRQFNHTRIVDDNERSYRIADMIPSFSFQPFIIEHTGNITSINTPVEVPKKKRKGGSPSFTPNNLTASAVSGQLAYIRLNDVVIVDLHQGVDITKVNIFNGRTTIYHVAYVSITVSSVKLSHLVICTRLGVQLWSENGERMIYFCPVNSLNGLEEENMHYMQGISASGSNVYIGTSMGTLLVFGSNRIDEFNLNHKIPTSKSCITTVASIDNLVACGNDDGDIFVLNSRNFESLGTCDGRGFSILSMIMSSQFIIGGYSTGHIRIFNTGTQDCIVEISAHIRMITGLALNPSNNSQFISVSEDQYVNIWEIKKLSLAANSVTADLVRSHRLDNKLCTGVTHMADGNIVVSCYEEDELIVIKK